jgi:fatty-acyl-CoA synthase
MPPPHFAHWPPGVPHEPTLPEVSVYRNLEASAARHPDKPLLYFYGTPLSYRRFAEEADALAGFLQQRGRVKMGDHVLLYLDNSPQFMIAYYACLRADAVVVPLNPKYPAEDLHHYAKDSGARVVVVGQELLAAVRPLLGDALDLAVVAAYSDYLSERTDLKVPDKVTTPRQEAGGPGVVAWREALAARLTPGPHIAGPGDLCVLPYTSGSTGKPKGCIHTHHGVMSTVVASALWVGLDADAVVLATLPLSHVTGMQNSMNVPIYLGATVVLTCPWDAETAARLIERHRVTAWVNVPRMVEDVLAGPALERCDLSSLRFVGGGGEAMQEAVAARLFERTGLHYLEGYGLSETMAPTHINPPHRPKRHCLGVPICHTEARVIDPKTLAEKGPGEEGEIVSRGPQVFLGYWKNDADTKPAFVNLGGRWFFRTGDLGYRDGDGYFFLAGRLKRMINVSGLKVSPETVEKKLSRHPAVQEVCVIATRDAGREAVKALVVLREDSRDTTTADDIRDWARANAGLAAYQAPRLVEIVESLPKSLTLKVDWRRLQEEEDRKV